MFDPICDHYVPAVKNLIIEYNDEHYRIENAEYSKSVDKWNVTIRKEWCDHKTKLQISNLDCYSRINYDWQNFTGVWTPAFPSIAQLDGIHIDNAHADNKNAGAKMLSFIDHWEENHDVIREMHQEIQEEGFDNEYLRNNKRYDENGFATEACNENDA